ncbi:retinaldehyde-binding protein 1-like isoform X1 [Diorhabda sublineata]|uniref:retinaldehyde-binding protein 1-like isoform X1 n=1 Tax=Diorhabda sublineata TaxID=1163346 RepID=UPI0024E0B1EB|nr:retinaldehyde-binding protein 1-like isoform X1 [Diorhabda sublineata]
MIESSVLVDGNNEISQQFQKCMENLRNLVKNADIEANDDYLKRYLYGTDMNVEESFKKIKNCHDHMKQYKDWYCKDGPLKFKNFIDKNIRIALEDCDKEGRPIYVCKNGNIEPNNMSIFDVVAVDDVWIESILNENPEVAAKGLCVIMDIKDQHWKLTKWLQPDIIKQSIMKIDNLPFKNFKVHVVNNSWWISIAIKIVWPFLPQKLKDMIKFHFDNKEVFFQYIDRKVLPIEYGGLKEIKYSELYDNLYKKNEEIFSSFTVNRK